MAFIKSIALPTGVSGDYWRMVGFKWERGSREASAHFSLFKDAATAAAGQPLVPIAAKLRLYGDKFDDYLSPTALAAAEQDVVAQLYQAAKDTCEAYAEGEPPTTDPQAHVICDYGKGVFADAVEG
ncbi:MAG: hypothetical protein V4773_04310 [Verrucomicrobiota bacterium]